MVDCPLMEPRCFAFLAAVFLTLFVVIGTIDGNFVWGKGN
jgi:hypothetical protein